METHPFTTGRWFGNINNPNLLEKWINNNDYFAYMPNKEIKSIFLGTFPIWQISTGEVADENFEFFYGSSVNDFWSCLGDIFEVEVNIIENGLSILEDYNLGITDILKKVDRNPENDNGDIALTQLCYNNIVGLKNEFPKIENIFITSGGKRRIGNLNANNKNVATWLKNSFVLQGFNLTGFNQNGFVKRVSVNDWNFNLISLYSPSNNANCSIQGILNTNGNFGVNNLDIGAFRRLQWGYFLRKYHLGENNNNNIIENIWEDVNNNQALVDFFEN